jgi:anti-anti-sigma factor
MIETLSPVGDLDELVLDELEAQLSAVASDCDLVVDFTEVTFCGSGCIRLLIETHNRLRDGGGSMVVRNVRTGVRRAFSEGAVDFLLEPEPEGNGRGDAA